jgi:hypothetical protein
MVEPELLEMMTQKVRLYATGATDAYGRKTFATTPVEAPCHIDGHTKEVFSKGGEVAMAQGVAYLSTVYPWLTEACRIDVPELSSATGWRRANIITVDTTYDETGPYNQVIYYGAA